MRSMVAADEIGATECVHMWHVTNWSWFAGCACCCGCWHLAHNYGEWGCAGAVRWYHWWEGKASSCRSALLETTKSSDSVRDRDRENYAEELGEMIWKFEKVWMWKKLCCFIWFCVFLSTGIGSGGPFALAAARALIDIDGLGAEAIGAHPHNVTSSRIWTLKYYHIFFLNVHIISSTSIIDISTSLNQ